MNIPTDEDDPDAQQKKQRYTKADKHDIEVLKNEIEEFAKAVGDTEQNVRIGLNILSYEKLSSADAMRALQQVIELKRQYGGNNQ
nr:hypothetical protein [Staphylococcus pseudintermedius]